MKKETEENIFKDMDFLKVRFNGCDGMFLRKTGKG